MTTGRLEIACSCGALRGEVQIVPRGGQRVVCYCDDCQAYAFHLEREADVLDARGGTDIYQTMPALLRVERGLDQLACVRLSERGLMRWYARCCRTPIGNTLPFARGPFVGIVLACVDPSARERALGPPVLRAQGRFAIGGVPEGAEPGASLRTMLRGVRLLARGLLARGHTPSPFFDRETGAPRAVARILSPAQRDRARARVVEAHARGST